MVQSSLKCVGGIALTSVRFQSSIALLFLLNYRPSCSAPPPISPGSGSGNPLRQGSLAPYGMLGIHDSGALVIEELLVLTLGFLWSAWHNILASLQNRFGCFCQPSRPRSLFSSVLFCFVFGGGGKVEIMYWKNI